MSWASNAAANLLPLSKEKQDLKKAIKEWFYREGNMQDLEYDREDCELCEHPDIRYQFQIVNQFTRSQLWVGSKCIEKFEILAIDKRGDILSLEDSRRKIKQDRTSLIAQAKRKKVISLLRHLSKKETKLNIDSFISDFVNRGAFTPKQLNFLLWKLESNNVNYNVSTLKLRIRKNREKEQLLDMPNWQVKRLWEAMSKTQQEWYSTNKK